MATKKPKIGRPRRERAASTRLVAFRVTDAELAALEVLCIEEGCATISELLRKRTIGGGK